MHSNECNNHLNRADLTDGLFSGSLESISVSKLCRFIGNQSGGVVTCWLLTSAGLMEEPLCDLRSWTSVAAMAKVSPLSSEL